MTKAITTTSSEVAAPTQAGGAADLIRMATEQGAGIEVIERMAALYERERADHRRKAYYAALAQFQADCPDIERHDKAHNSKYAKLERIVGAIKPALKDCGLTYRYEISNTDNGGVSVTCIVTHIDGHSERTTMQAAPDTSGSKNAIQAAGSTVTYMQRYTLCGALGLVTVDEDNDGGKPAQTINAAQAKQLKDLFERSGLDVKRCLAWAKCASIDELPADKFQEACNRCLTEIAKQTSNKDELPL